MDELNERLRGRRPAERLSKGIYARYGILSPDVSFLPEHIKLLLTTTKTTTSINDDTFSVEIKPKQGWTFDSMVATTDKCRYCLLQYLKVCIFFTIKMVLYSECCIKVQAIKEKKTQPNELSVK